MTEFSGFITKKQYEEIISARPSVVSYEQIEIMKNILSPLIGIQFNILSLHKEILMGFEPSQIGTIVGTLMDACIPQLSSIPTISTLPNLGLHKHEGVLGEREGYPDFLHESGIRLELKLLYVDNKNIQMKKPPTPREPSARLTQKVTFKNVIPDRDVLLVIAYSLEENEKTPDCYSPTIKSFKLFPIYDCILARDLRMYQEKGGWFGNFETPTILSNIGKAKLASGEKLDYSMYGRKESEGRDFNEDTNFGKLKRIPYKPLQDFLAEFK